MAALASGFAMLLTPKLIAFMFIGVVVGIIFGAIPGLSATMAIVLFLPITFNMTVYEAFAMLVALYIGGVSGGLVSAILINIPGSAMSIATTYDGNPMANSGHAQRARHRHRLFVLRHDPQRSHYDRRRAEPRVRRGQAGRL